MADNDQLSRLATFGAIAAGGFAAYEFLYKPWALQQHLAMVAQQAALAKGPNITDAATAAVGAACVAGAAAYGAPPTVAGPICQGLAPLAVAGAKEVAKGAIIAGKVVGKGIGKGAVAVGSGVKTATKAVGSTAKKAVKSISHGFGLWGVDVDGLGDVADSGNPFASVGGRARSSGVERTKQPRARGGLPRTKQAQPRGAKAAAADFYLRHL